MNTRVYLWIVIFCTHMQVLPSLSLLFDIPGEDSAESRSLVYWNNNNGEGDEKEFLQELRGRPTQETVQHVPATKESRSLFFYCFDHADNRSENEYTSELMSSKNKAKALLFPMEKIVAKQKRCSIS